jgi:gliding motility-associated lipoprotein GldD
MVFVKRLLYLSAVAALGGLLLSLFACNESYTPKPRGYFRIAMPERGYIAYDAAGCPFSFDVPVYSMVKPYRDSILQPCWKYIFLPGFNAEIFLSYHPVNNDAGQFFEDARALAYKHSVKADAIDETLVFAGPGVSGMIYDISGSAASPIQFYVTDSVRHFLRGALYFNATPQPDSLAPVVAFLRGDIERIIKTVSWK